MSKRDLEKTYPKGMIASVTVVGAIFAVFLAHSTHEWVVLSRLRGQTLSLVEKTANRLAGDVNTDTHALNRPGEGVEFTLPVKDVWGRNLTAVYGKHLTQETVEVRSFAEDGVEGSPDDITASQSQWNFGGMTAVGSETIRKVASKSIRGVADGVGEAAESVGGRVKQWWRGKPTPKPQTPEKTK